MFLNNTNIDKPCKSDAVFYLNESIIFDSLVLLDLSNNKITDQITDLSVFSPLKYVSLANNQLDGSVDLEQVSCHNGISYSLTDIQTIEWKYTDYIGNNSFVGSVGISYFEHCKNLRYTYFKVANNSCTSFEDFDDPDHESISDVYMTGYRLEGSYSTITILLLSNNLISIVFQVLVITN